MPLNTAGSILEGVRLSQSCNKYVFPPDNFVSDDKIPVFNSISRNSEYCLWASGQDVWEDGLYIGRDNLFFYWTRNDVISRFGYDSGNQRFFPNPGNTPIKLGPITNSPRLKVSKPYSSELTISPYSIFIGLPRIASLDIEFVTNSSLFTDLPSGRVQISAFDGECNFSTLDINNPAYSNVDLYYCRQSFYDRQQVTGAIGSVSESGDYQAYLNPIPGNGSIPLVRVGNRKYLDVTLYSHEASMPDPVSPAQCNISLDTGRLKLKIIDEYLLETIYYDGLALGKITQTKIPLGKNTSGITVFAQKVGTFPQFIGLTDESRYSIVGKHLGDPDYYLRVAIVDEDPEFGDSGFVSLNKNTGDLFLSAIDASSLTDFEFYAYDNYLVVDDLITFKIYRSSLNGIGNSTVPDFVEYYTVFDKAQIYSLSSSPFFFLPAKPLDDYLLSFEVKQNEAGSGYYTGTLKTAASPDNHGVGYYIDFNKKQFFLTNRKTVTIPIEYPSDTLKLPDQALYDEGIVASLNSNPLTTFVDFDVNTTSGVVEFTEPLGELNPENINSLNGRIVGNDTFVSTTPVFNQQYVNSYLYIPYGVNAGLYVIASVIDSFTVRSDSMFPVPGDQVVNVRKTQETLAANFWSDLTVPLRKFQLFKGDSVGGTLEKVQDSKFSVQSDAGLIQLKTAVNPNDVLKATYEYEYSSDGVTTEIVSTSEYLSSKVRLVQGEYITGSRFFTFDTGNRTVLSDQPISVVVDGVSVDPTKFFFVQPNRIEVGDPLTDQEVFVSFNVAELNGGVRTFNTQHSPVVTDYPTFSSGSNSVALNGDQTGDITINTALMVVNRIYVVRSSTYDESSDVTTVEFTTGIVDDYKGYFRICDPLVFVGVNETYKTVVDGSTSVVMVGNSSIKTNMLITIGGDPYYVTNSNFDGSSNTTTLTLSNSTNRNYIGLPVTRSTLPVQYAGVDFNTSKSALTGKPFTLFLDSSTAKRQLTPIIDYSVADGGVIKLNSPLSRGSKLHAMYVARDYKPAGSVYKINYAYSIAPTEDNGILGQDLFGSFHIYSPDSFYFRDSTIVNFVPEVSAAVGSSGGPAGPTTGASPALGLKDYGISSLGFSEKHYANLDDVTSRLLYYFNEITNMYEDLLSDYDGRVVGGTSGKFRYDGSSGAKRESISQVKNDIDDMIHAYDEWMGVDYLPYFDQVPVYIPLYNYSASSRLFPTKTTRNFIINSNVTTDDRDKVMSNIGVSDITDLSFIYSSPALSHFETTDGSILTLKTNGDRKKFVPAFEAEMPIAVYDNSGKLITTTTVTSVTGDGPYQVSIPISLSIRSGGIALLNQVGAGETGASWPNNKLYKSIDYNIDNSTGNLINSTYSFLVGLGIQSEFVKGDYLTVVAEYTNKNTSPKRLPVLYGQVYNDSGFPSNPPLFRPNEMSCLEAEAEYLQSTEYHGYATVIANNRIITSNGVLFPLNVPYKFMGGPNSTYTFSVVSYDPGNVMVTDVNSLSIDSVPRFVTSVGAYSKYVTTLQTLMNIQSNVLASGPESGQIIGPVNNEHLQKKVIVEYMGETVFNGTGTVNGVTLTSDSELPYPLYSSYVYISSGVNEGLYKISDSSLNTITVNSEQPYYSFPVPSTVTFRVIKRYGFMTDAGPSFLAAAMKNDNEFAAVTKAWANAINPDDLNARNFAVVERQAQLSNQITLCENVMKSGDSLYNRRYIWISQRVDKKSGFLTMKTQAVTRRVEDTMKLIENQQKALALSALQST